MQTRPGKTKRLLVIAVVILVLCAFAALAVVFTACTSNKYIVAAGLPDPDSGYQTGTIYGYDLWIWDCYQSKHIVLWRTSAEFTVGQYTREESPCGAQTPIEIKLANEPKRERDPKSFW